MTVFQVRVIGTGFEMRSSLFFFNDTFVYFLDEYIFSMFLKE